MNIEVMQKDLNKLYEGWHAEVTSVDIVGEKREWIRGVCHGIKLALQMVDFHVRSTRT